METGEDVRREPLPGGEKEAALDGPLPKMRQCLPHLPLLRHLPHHLLQVVAEVQEKRPPRTGGALPGPQEEKGKRHPLGGGGAGGQPQKGVPRLVQAQDSGNLKEGPRHLAILLLGGPDSQKERPLRGAPGEKEAAARRRAKRRRAERLLRDLYPGSLIQVDTKRLCVFGTTYYQFTAVDSFSRLSFIRIFGSSSSRSGRRFLEELRDFLPFRIHAVQTDNGSEYLKEFEKELQEAGVDHYFTYPRCPQQNARVERKIQSSQYEYWDHRLWGKDLEELNHMADEWNYIYNHVRPHQSLGYLTPAEFLRQWQEEKQRRDKVFTM